MSPIARECDWPKIVNLNLLPIENISHPAQTPKILKKGRIILFDRFPPPDHNRLFADRRSSALPECCAAGGLAGPGPCYLDRASNRTLFNLTDLSLETGSGQGQDTLAIKQQR